MTRHDVLIIGGGPGGSHAATVLAQQGVDVAVIERETYPRFHIGESLLPATMPLFKKTGFYEVLQNGDYLSKSGARFIDYRSDAQIYFGFADGLNPDIPSAFEVERCVFDHDILQFAKRAGATVYQPEIVLEIDLREDAVHVQTNHRRLTAEYLLDISGRDALLGKHFKLREVNQDLNNIAVFAHFKGVKRFAGPSEGDICIGLLPDGAWTWIIPFKGEITSVGVVAAAKFFGNPDLETYFREKLLKADSVAEYMRHAERVTPFRSIGNYSHTCSRFFGERWMMCGDAALFLDPIFSSGVHLSVSSSQLAAETILRALGDKLSLRQRELGPAYESKVRRGAMRFHNLISMFYTGNFVELMNKSLTRDNIRRGMVSAIAGDVWNEDNFIFSKNVL